MGTNRISSLAVVGAALLGAALSGSASGATDSDEVGVLECRPVAVTWPASSAGARQVEGPKLSVVQTRVKPKSARLFLDGRFVGRAHYFRGKKGFLYLLPGRYRLEVVKEGFDTVEFTILARPSCKFDLEVSMTKRKGSGTEYAGIPSGKGEPIQWIYGPVDQPTAVRSSGPDPSLRKDLSETPPP